MPLQELLWMLMFEHRCKPSPEAVCDAKGRECSGLGPG